MDPTGTLPKFTAVGLTPSAPESVVPEFVCGCGIAFSTGQAGASGLEDGSQKDYRIYEKSKKLRNSVRLRFDGALASAIALTQLCSHLANWFWSARREGVPAQVNSERGSELRLAYEGAQKGSTGGWSRLRTGCRKKRYRSVLTQMKEHSQ